MHTLRDINESKRYYVYRIFFLRIHISIQIINKIVIVSWTERETYYHILHSYHAHHNEPKVHTRLTCESKSCQNETTNGKCPEMESLAVSHVKSWIF